MTTKLMPSIPELNKSGTYRLLTPDKCCVVEEKIDGSQINFWLDNDGQLLVGGRRHMFSLDNPPPKYRLAVEHLVLFQDHIKPGLTYRGEVVTERKQSTKEYERVPDGYIIVFDIQCADESFLTPVDRNIAVKNLGVEYAHCFHIGPVTAPLLIDIICERDSMLGGTIEGVVVKDHDNYGPDRMVAKFVSDDFQEVHVQDWHHQPNPNAMITTLVQMLSTEARFRKALQTMEEDEVLTGTGRDIGELCKRVRDDVVKEESKRLTQEWNEYWSTRPGANHPTAATMLDRVCKLLNNSVAVWYKGQI